MAPLVDHDRPPTNADIVFYQTAAGPSYEEMIRVAEPVHRAYCRANHIDYVVYFGVRRGFYPWQATFNRIEALHDLLVTDFRGWFLYVDADAVVRHEGFDIRRYLGKRDQSALIAAPAVGAGDARWNINAGIFFLNLGHELGREIARRWYAAAHSIVSEQMLRDAVEPWQPLLDGREFPDDQHLLQMELMRDDALSNAMLVDVEGVINRAAGRFIRQFTRVLGTPEDRLAMLRESVAAVLDQRLPNRSR